MLLALALGACTSSPESAPEADPREAVSLVGEYSVEWIEDRPVVDRSPTFVAFSDDGRVYGDAGCNRFSGTWSLAGEVLTLSPLATTKRAGPPALMEQEARFLAALSRVERARLESGQLALTTADGRELVRATRRQPAVVRGTATYRERIALAPGHTLEVTLADVTRADAAADVLARTTVDVSGQVPIAFELAYERARVRADHRYDVRAKLVDPEGRLAWTSTTATPVRLDGEAPSDVAIRLERVAR